MSAEPPGGTPSTVASTPPLAQGGWPLSARKGGPNKSRTIDELDRPTTVPSGVRPRSNQLPRRPNTTATSRARGLGAGGDGRSVESIAAKLEAELLSGNFKPNATLAAKPIRKGLQRGMRTTTGLTEGPTSPRGREAWAAGSSPKRSGTMGMSSLNATAASNQPQGSGAEKASEKVELPSMSPDTSHAGDRLVHEAFRGKPVERCSRCTMHSVWTACDTFWEFDQDHTGTMSRKEYIDLLGESPTVNRLRMLRRARLEHQFRSSAKPVTLEKFLGLIWPQATEEDRKKMARWAQLREAHDILNSANFRGADSDMRRIFELLRTRIPGESTLGGVVASEMLRALIISEDFMLSIAKGVPLKEFTIDTEAEFKESVWPHLKQRWVTRETILKMKREEEQAMANSFEVAFGKLGPGQSK